MNIDNKLYKEIDLLRSELERERQAYESLSEMHKAAKEDWWDEREKLQAEIKFLKKKEDNLQQMNSLLRDMGKQLLFAVKLVYQKCWFNGTFMSWGRLKNVLRNALCEAEGEDQVKLWEEHMRDGGKGYE